MTNDRPPARTVRSASRALDIIEIVADAGRIRHAQVAARLKIPKSTTTLLLDTLVASGYLKRDEETHSISLGSRILAIASRYLAEQNVVQAAQPVLSHLVAELDESCFLVGAESDVAVVLWREICRHRLTYAMPLGERIPLTATAGGIAILAFRDPAEQRRLVGLERAADAARITQQLGNVVAGEVACSEGYVFGVASLALPLFNHLGDAPAALSVALPEARLDAEARKRIAAALRRGQQEITGSLGGRVPPQIRGA